MSDPVSGSPPIIGRMLSVPEWVQYCASYPLPKSMTRVVLHHTWRPTADQWRGTTSVRNLQRYYGQKGWSSGPHFFVGPDGIWLFTPMKDVGIHANAGNSGSWGYSVGIEMVGDYDKVRPSGAIWAASVAIMGELSRKTGITPRDLIFFHRDFSSKSCPGWAVTKDWVFGEVEAYVAKQAPPPPPPIGQVGTPTPEVEELWELLLDKAYARRGEGYNNSWAFHDYATRNTMGFPMARSARMTVDGKEFAYQVFARDTLYNEIPKWGEVKTMSELLAGSIPPGGLGRALLEATFAVGGSPFRADWAFHQYTMSAKLGPPLGPAQNMIVDTNKYSYQVFAGDTLFNLVPNWKDVRRLSEILGTGDAHTQRLRDALLQATYGQAGAKYRPDWAFHQFANRIWLGAPLGDSEKVKVMTSGVEYTLQVYATDLLYNQVPNWSDVRRLGDLLRTAAPGVLGEVSFSAGSKEAAEPPLPEGLVVTVQLPGSIATSSRTGSRPRLLVLHGYEGAADNAIAAMTSLDADHAVHYFVRRDGEVVQLVDLSQAAWHAGMARWGGRTQNINRISVGIGLENGLGDYPAMQRDALVMLADYLCTRFGIPASQVVRWSDLNTRAPETLGRFPLKTFRQQLLTALRS